jgi:uncharacterized protein (DUF305 family)
MNTTTIGIVAGALIIGGILGFIVANPWNGTQNTHRMSDGSHMQHMNHGMMDHSMMVQSERDFLVEMIPHHEEAVTTARQVLARGGSTAEMRTLAQNIITAQEKEISDMKRWHEEWYGTPYQPSGNYKPMMRDLSNLKGAELDKVFLEDMVMHHMGAIMMAESVQPHIEHDEIRILTEAIIRTQSEEIRFMKDLLTRI